MLIMYKLLAQDMTSHNGMPWEIGKENVATGKGTKLCTAGVLHCYNDPRLAVILNPIHANYRCPRLFEISVDKIVASDGTKFASKRQTLLRELTLPDITLEQKITFAINCALAVCTDAKFMRWANKWLSGEDRSKKAAYDARAADYDAYDAYDAYAAYATARAARAAAAAAYAYAAAYDAAATAYAAAYAAYDADAAAGFNLIEILNKSM